MANFESFCRVISSTINLLFLKSDIWYAELEIIAAIFNNVRENNENKIHVFDHESIRVVIRFTYLFHHVFYAFSDFPIMLNLMVKYLKMYINS